MADSCQVILAIGRGEYDRDLGHIAQAVTQRLSDLADLAKVFRALTTYAELTGISLEELPTNDEE